MGKIQYSKILPVVTCIIFCTCLIVGFSVDMTTIIDVSFYATTVTVSGTIFLSSLVWYAKKASQENSIKLKTEFYKATIQAKLNYNKKMMIYKTKYGIYDEFDEDDNAFENIISDTLSSTVSQLDEDINNADTVEIESI